MKKMSTQDSTNTSNKNNHSPYVIVYVGHNIGDTADSFKLAYEGGFLTHISDGYYQCKRIVASDFSLVIMSNFPLPNK